MGIKRCPYCRALISDRDQYCKNCGTQLLFPEDEEIEEEIPGDKIIEDDRQKDESDLLAGEEPDKEGSEQEEELEEELELEEETVKPTGEVVLKEDTAPLEETEVEKITATARKRARSRDLSITAEEKLLFAGEKEPEAPEIEPAASPRTEDFLVEKIKKEVLDEGEPEPEEPAKTGPGVVTRIVEELRRKEEQEESTEAASEARPGLVTRMVEELELEEKRAGAESYETETGEEEADVAQTFATAELEKIGATTELGRREVEDFFKVLEEKEKEHLKERLKTSGKGAEGTGEVPSWIKEVKTASTELLGGTEGTGEVKAPEKVEAETDELWLEEEETQTEPTMGFPERLTRSGLEAVEAQDEASREEEMELEEEIEEPEEEIEGETGKIFREKAEPAMAGGAISTGGIQAGESRSLPPLGFKNFVKAKIFDLLFLVMFWLVSIWIAARSMQTTIFKLFGLAGSGLLLYLLILTFFYFFLFYFFIGETLGDRLFREGEEEEDSL